MGVLTLFGRVTGEVLGEGIHLINPLNTNNEMSIQAQTIKESASVPSSEGLVMNLDTSLVYHLNPEKAAEAFQKIGANYEEVVVEPTLRARSASRPLRIPRMPYTPVSGKWSPSRSVIN